MLLATGGYVAANEGVCGASPKQKLPIFSAMARPTGTWTSGFKATPTSPLNDLGVSQAHGAARVLESCAIDVIVSSPLVRALKTAAIVGERLQKPLFIDSELKERHFGSSFEGLRVDEVKNRLGLQPHERLAQHLPADAEQWQETRARVIRVMGKWLDRYPDGTILFVAHGGLFDALHEIIFQSRIETGARSPTFGATAETVGLAKRSE